MKATTNDKVITYFKTGNSFPIVLEKDDSKYLVKLRGGLSGKYAILNEWTGNCIGAQIGLNTRMPIWIPLSENLELESINLEVQELIKKSLGLNIGFEYFEVIEELTADDLLKINESERKRLFLLDLLMINVDRTEFNTNLVKANHRVYSLDYESSLIFQEVIENKDLLDHKRILQSLKENPLYLELAKSDIDTFIDEVNQLSFEAILKSIPGSFLPSVDLSTIFKQLKKRKAVGWRIEETVDQLKAIQLESKAIKLERMRKNRDKFEDSMKGGLASGK